MVFDPTMSETRKSIRRSGDIMRDNIKQRGAIQQQQSDMQQAFAMMQFKQEHQLKMAEAKDPKLATWNRIQKKKTAGFPLTSLETRFEEDMIGSMVKKKTETEKYRGKLRQAISGDISWNDINQEYPDKISATGTARISSLSPVSQNVVKQIQKQINTSGDRNTTARELLGELVKRKDEAKQKGIEIDEIMDILGVKETELNKPGFLKKMMWFLQDMNPFGD